jgi:hypothetical protein
MPIFSGVGSGRFVAVGLSMRKAELENALFAKSD